MYVWSKCYAILINNIFILHDWLELRTYTIVQNVSSFSVIIDFVHFIHIRALETALHNNKPKKKREIMQIYIAMKKTTTKTKFSIK